MIEPVFEDLDAVVEREVARAKQEHGETYHSPHEAYAVLREEIEEAQRCLRDVEEAFFKKDTGLPRKGVWGLVSLTRMGKPSKEQLAAVLRDVMTDAKYGAAELVQVAAVCRKTLDSMDAWEQKKA